MLDGNAHSITSLQTTASSCGERDLSFVLSVFPTFAVGGAQARFCAVANHHGQRLRHAIVAMDGNVACRERLDPGLDVRLLDLAIAKGDPLRTLRLLRSVLHAERPDVLLTHNWGSIEWALANAPPFTNQLARHVHVEDGFGPEERDRQIGRRVWMRRLALRRAIVALPSLLLMQLATNTWRLDERQLRYVPNGVDLLRFAPRARADAASAAPAPLGAAEGLVVGTVAALRPEKNLGRLLRAFAMAQRTYPELRLLIVGEGPERASLMEITVRMGITGRVSFAGHLADPAAAYAQMDMFALSSDTEQMPLSVLEAMAAGLPVASTDVGDVTAMLPPENAPLIVPRDDESLAAALGRLAADARLRQVVGAANRAKVARDYDQATMFAAWGGLLGVSEDTSRSDI